MAPCFAHGRRWVRAELACDGYAARCNLAVLGAPCLCAALLSEHFGKDDALAFCKDAQVCMLRLHASAVRQYMDCVMTRALLR